MRPKEPVAETQSACADEEWLSYARVESLVDHWDRPGWTPSRHSYHWLISMDDPALHSLAERCQAALEDLPSFDAIPLSSLHITLARAGFVDELTEVEALATADMAQELLHGIEPFEIRIGPLTGSTGAVRFSARPHESVTQLRTAARTAVARVREPERYSYESPERFIPHVSIAYCHQAGPAQPVIKRVAQLRSFRTVTVRVAAIQLVNMWREGRTYRWDVLRAADLGEAGKKPA